MMMNDFVIKAIKEQYKIEITNCCEVPGLTSSTIYLEVKSKNSYVYISKKITYDDKNKIEKLAEFVQYHKNTHEEMVRESYYKRNFYRTIYLAFKTRNMFDKDAGVFALLERSFSELDMTRRIIKYVDSKIKGNEQITFGEVYDYCLKNYAIDELRELQRG